MIAGDVHEAFAKLDAARPSSGSVYHETTLLWQWQSLPILFPEEREALDKRLDALREEDSRN